MPITVRRSRNGDRDTLSIVHNGDGSDLGWYDLENDEGHPESELWSLVVDAAGAGWRRGSGSPILDGASALINVALVHDAACARLTVYAYDGTELGSYDLEHDANTPGSESMEHVVLAAALGYQVGRRSAPRTDRKPNLHLTRIRKAGTDKLFVTGYDGTDLGWYDLTTGLTNPESELMSLVVEAAGLGWKSGMRSAESGLGALVAQTSAEPLPWRSAVEVVDAHLRELVRHDSRWRYSTQNVRISSQASADVQILAGPPGVFLISAQDFADGQLTVRDDALWVNGERSDLLDQGRFGARYFTAYLSSVVEAPVVTRPVIASVRSNRLSLCAPADGVDVVVSDCLVQWLKQRPELVCGSQLTKLLDSTEDTWKLMTRAAQRAGV